MKIILILLFIVLMQCNYEPIYSEKSGQIKIYKIENNNNNRINKTLSSKLKYLETNNKADEIQILLGDSEEKKEIISKDTKGDPSKFRLKIISSVDLKNKDKILFSNNYSVYFDYSNNSKKFELNQYEEEIKIDLINQIVSQIIFDLQQIK